MQRHAGCLPGSQCGGASLLLGNISAELKFNLSSMPCHALSLLGFELEKLPLLQFLFLSGCQ